MTDIPLAKQYELMDEFKGTTRYEPEPPEDKIPDVPDPDEETD